MSSQNDPISLTEDEATGDRFLIFGTDSGLQLDIRFEGDTLWMTQAQIAQLFGRDRSVITKHIQNIFDEGELDEQSNVQKMHFARSTKPVAIYSLDLIISVGYRVSSAQATQFRRWATGILVQYAKNGFAIDSVRLKSPDNRDRLKELREAIREIRAEEANVYRELKQICLMCADYEKSSPKWANFYKQTQARLVYAVTSHTPSEVIRDRADATQPNMGLTSWPNDNIRKADVTVSKNYLAEGEIKELNRLTNIILDVFEDQADLGRLATMRDVEQKLEEQLSNLGRSVLQGGGSVSKSHADAHASDEYSKFKAAQKQLRHQQADTDIAALAKQVKGISRGRG